jgi:hypothetical protein
MAHPDELDVRVSFSVKVNAREWNRTDEKMSKAQVRSGVRRYLSVLADQELEKMGVLFDELAQS